ncbi:MAG: alanyl aminopeptidase, partial [Saprospiraceae bacterium]|nr:alanyl aminopeptidase [Saprospiraceae bacterium]
HEMFHHWFGDLVTCESWSNLTLNEGFANYSEYLWLEHNYGKDEADNHLMTECEGYIQSSMDGIHPLIYFEYADKEDMFDAHSYNKGGLVLHMLRNYIGDEAFFAGLKRYLDVNAYTEVEADELRIAFEDVVGEDLNWFFNQWYFAAGHPELEIEYGYVDGQATVTVEQVQDPEVQPAIFEIPTTVDIYLADGTKVRKEIRVTERLQTFTFDVPSEPKLVTFDGDRTVLCDFVDNKTEAQLAYQYQHCTTFRDRWEALEKLEGSSDAASANIYNAALMDPFYSIRALAVANCRKDGRNMMTLQKMAESDPHSSVREAALYQLVESDIDGNADLAKRVIEKEQAYPVVAAALQLLNANDSEAALKVAKKLESEKNGDILAAVGQIYSETGDSKYLSFFEDNFGEVEFFSAITFFQLYGQLAVKGDLDQVLASGKILSAYGTDMGQSPWRRFGSMGALNSLHAELVSRLDDADMLTEEAKTKLKEGDNSLIKMIEMVKSAETNPQLLGMYQNFPNPPAKP